MTNGYYSNTVLTFPHADAGIRYMFNNKFGIKADFGYDYMKSGDDSKYFRTTVYRTSLQGVANLGRIMNFEEWTKSLNVQAHLGAGYTYMTPSKEPKVYEKDQSGHVILGLTGQIKLTNRVAFNADFSMVNTIRQDKAFDGNSNTNRRGFTGSYYNASVGLSFYLGGNEEHADWVGVDALTGRVVSLENRVSDIENKMVDSDNDGVADYLDLEPNTPAGNLVDVKGRSIDMNRNGIPDSYEKYFADNYSSSSSQLSPADSNTVKGMINSGYVAVYFDFDKSTPKSTDAIGFILTYLNSNPNATVTVNGYADTVGSSSYNQRLSSKRANKVAKMLEKAGVSSSRISVDAKGEDGSVSGRNQFARKVTFQVN